MVRLARSSVSWRIGFYIAAAFLVKLLFLDSFRLLREKILKVIPFIGLSVFGRWIDSLELSWLPPVR